MELSLVHNDPSRTLLVTSDTPLYEITTPKSSPGSPITIVRIEGEVSTGHVGTEVGRVEHHGSRGMRLYLCSSYPSLELTLCPYEATELENSWTFTGPDNRPYKWQIFVRSPVLILNDNSSAPLARYRRAKLGIVSRSRRAFLEVLPAGLGVVDLIVVTFVLFMKQRMTIDYSPAT